MKIVGVATIDSIRYPTVMNQSNNEYARHASAQLWGAILGWNGAVIGFLAISLVAGVVPQTWDLLIGGFVLCNGMCFLVNGDLLASPSRDAPAPFRVQLARLAVGMGVLLLVTAHFVAPRVDAMPEFDFVRWLPWRIPDAVSLGLIAIGFTVGAISAVRTRPSPSR